MKTATMIFFAKLMSVTLLAPCVLAQSTTFSDRIVIAPEADGPTDVSATDLDGDGDLDFVVTAGSEVAWYENTDGAGSFLSKRLIADGFGGASCLFVADVDGDSDPDVVAGAGSGDEVAWFENLDGQGSFGQKRSITTDTNGPTSVFAADFDGDGDLDLLSTSEVDTKVAWYENTDGQGAFSAQNIISTGANGAADGLAADLDGDGDLDVVAAIRWDSRIHWYENTDGQGSFGPAQLLGTSGRVSAVDAADLDGDGDVDVAATGWLSDEVVWFRNTDGEGAFERIVVDADTEDPLDVRIADVDGDGDPDLLAAADLFYMVAWYENTDGQGAFGARQLISDAGDAVSLFTADVDGDSDLDVLAASNADDAVEWYEHLDGQGSFSERRTLTLDPKIRTMARTADLDDDGDLDVYYGSWSHGQVFWFENLDTEPWFGLHKVAVEDAVGVECVFAADLDGDGDLDLLAGSWTAEGCEIAWFEHLDGMGLFGPRQTITTELESPRFVAAADLDGDFDLDVIYASDSDNVLAWHENTDGDGTFGAQRRINDDTNTDYVRYAEAADIDGDGDLDLLSASYFDAKVAWFENTDGQGTFGAQHVISTEADRAWTVHAADLDGDGDLDVLSASQTDDKIAWYENTDGQGTFGAQQVISAAADSASHVMAADLDLDGDLDVLSASARDEKVAWYENTDGQGSFGAQQVISTSALGAYSVFPFDPDSDGDPDLLVASARQGAPEIVGWFENQFVAADCGDGVVGAGEDSDPGAPANDVSCHPETCRWMADGSACQDDGLFCNGAEECAAGACVSPGNPCAETECNHCDENADSCFDPVGSACSDDGLFCTGAETCDGAGACVSGGDPCEDPLICDEGLGACTGCSSDEECPVCQRCESGSGVCLSLDAGTSCSDGDACNGEEVCDGAGFCQAGTALVCDDGLFCNGLETCDAQSGCVVGDDPCDDGDACTVDTCDEDADACVHDADPACEEEPDPGGGCGCGTASGGGPAALLMLCVGLYWGYRRRAQA